MINWEAGRFDSSRVHVFTEPGGSWTVPRECEGERSRRVRLPPSCRASGRWSGTILRAQPSGTTSSTKLADDEVAWFLPAPPLTWSGSSTEERCFHTADVAGSTPARTTSQDGCRLSWTGRGNRRNAAAAAHPVPRLHTPRRSNGKTLGPQPRDRGFDPRTRYRGRRTSSPDETQTGSIPGLDGSPAVCAVGVKGFDPPRGLCTVSSHCTSSTDRAPAS